MRRDQAIALPQELEEKAAAPPQTRPVGLRGFFHKLFRQKLAILGMILIGIVVMTAVFADASWITLGKNHQLIIARYPYAKASLHTGSVIQGPSAAHILGTDYLGRDVFSRVVFGARVSLIVGLVAVTIAVMIGVTLGLVAGFAGGWLDDVVIMRIVDMLMAFPTLILLLVLAFALGPSITTTMIVIGIVYSPYVARLTRAIVLSTREEVYVEAARVIGASNSRIAVAHILPNVVPQILVLASLMMAGTILYEATLSFLGLGIQPPVPAWGSMLKDSFRLVEITPVPAVAPGVAIFLTVIGFSFLGDGVRDTIDPTLKL